MIKVSIFNRSTGNNAGTQRDEEGMSPRLRTFLLVAALRREENSDPYVGKGKRIERILEGLSVETSRRKTITERIGRALNKFIRN